MDLYPVFFKLYRHTTLPPPAKPSSLPWPLASLMNNLGIGLPTPSPPTPVTSGGDGEVPPTQAPIPRRVPYYVSAFVKTATLADVSCLGVGRGSLCVAILVCLQMGAARKGYWCNNEVLEPVRLWVFLKRIDC